ncbi:ATP-binding cassette domain-containing protein [Actinoplanes sp. NPDC051346]|uniref:ABC transporter ATP-binding protein n=1 Tax=Actinoplanes sp. NPDC051346 TaxID=3155048 RepID=UPI00341CE4D2
MSVLLARGAGVRRNRQWLFRDLDVSASAGDVVAVVGPPGSGRTTVLLALTQRFKLSAGTVEIAGTAALGYVPGVTEPESVLTVAEHIRERALLIGQPASGLALHGLDPAARGFALSPYEKRVLGLVLARIGKPQVVAVDGMDDGLNAAEREALWRLIADLAAEGVTVLISAREVDEALVSTVVSLGGPAREVPSATGVTAVGGLSGVSHTTEPAGSEDPIWETNTIEPAPGAGRDSVSDAKTEVIAPPASVAAGLPASSPVASSPAAPSPVASTPAAPSPAAPSPAASSPAVADSAASDSAVDESPADAEPIADAEPARPDQDDHHTDHFGAKK